LSVVDRLCRSWGVERTEGGKQVWFELVAADEATSDGEVLFDDLLLVEDEPGIGGAPAAGSTMRACAA
jgi:hypothetical protein